MLALARVLREAHPLRAHRRPLETLLLERERRLPGLPIDGRLALAQLATCRILCMGERRLALAPCREARALGLGLLVHRAHEHALPRELKLRLADGFDRLRAVVDDHRRVCEAWRVHLAGLKWCERGPLRHRLRRGRIILRVRRLEPHAHLQGARAQQHGRDVLAGLRAQEQASVQVDEVYEDEEEELGRHADEVVPEH